VVDTTINELTLLSTDYCNHLGEVVMYIGMVADMPEMIEDVTSWQPKTYEAHFEGSGLSVGPLAIEAYGVSEAKYREPFDREIEAFNERAVAGCEELQTAVTSEDKEYIAFVAGELSQALQSTMDRIAAIANGAEMDAPLVEEEAAEEEKGSLNQDDIDALF